MEIKFTLFPGAISGDRHFFEDGDQASVLLRRAESNGVDAVIVDAYGGLLDNLSLAALVSARTAHLQSAISHWPDVITPLAAASELMSIHNASGNGIMLRMANSSLSGEPPRVCRRPFRLSHAAMAGSSSMA